MKSNEEYRNSIDQKVNMIICKRKRRNRFIATVTSAVTCLVLVICAVTAIPNLINKDSLIENPGSSYVDPAGSKEETDGSQPFDGFVLTAYTAAEKDGMLTASFLSEETSVVLQPNVNVLLGKYNPLMSSVPGLPFRFNTEEDCEIEVSADKGTLCRWDIQNGMVTPCGKTTSCAKGEILYWSPLAESEESAENTENMEKAVVTVTATDNGKTIGQQKITIVSNDFMYSACVGELEII